MVNKLNELGRCQASTQWNVFLTSGVFLMAPRLKKKKKKSTEHVRHAHLTVACPP